MSNSTVFSGLAGRVRQFIGASLPGALSDAEARFGQLALELFHAQYEHNPAYRQLCTARRLRPDEVRHWQEIPAAPTAAFKELELTSLPVGERTRVFHSSGTTAQKPSRHFHSETSLRLYEASLLPWFQANVWRDLGTDSPLVALTPPPSNAPHSSLVHMFETAGRHLSAHAVFLGELDPQGGWTLNFDRVLATLQTVCSAGKPLVLAGTAFNFVHVLDALRERQTDLRLPTGSRVMETGGYKNRSRTLPKAELHDGIRRCLNVPAERIICEYGMSELSSQAYDQPETMDRTLRFPPWARALVISPETGREVAEGETGLLKIFDLANVYSVLAVQTEDLAIKRGGGFALLGRAALAEPRGCSLMTAENFWPTAA